MLPSNNHNGIIPGLFLKVIMPRRDSPEIINSVNIKGLLHSGALTEGPD